MPAPVAAYYQNDRGQWVTTDTAICTVVAPRTLKPPNPEQFKHNNCKHKDFTLVGIYSPATPPQMAR